MFVFLIILRHFPSKHVSVYETKWRVGTQRPRLSATRTVRLTLNTADIVQLHTFGRPAHRVSSLSEQKFIKVSLVHSFFWVTTFIHILCMVTDSYQRVSHYGRVYGAEGGTDKGRHNMSDKWDLTPKVSEHSIEGNISFILFWEEYSRAHDSQAIRHVFDPQGKCV